MPQRVIPTPDACPSLARIAPHRVAALLMAFACIAAPGSPSYAQPASGERDPYIEHLPPAPRAAPAWQRIELGGAGRRYPFAIYASRQLDQPAQLRAVRRVIIAVHDDRRDAAQAYQAVTALYAGNRERADDTLVLAPKFPSAIEAGFGGLPVWRRGDWKDGQASASGNGRPRPVGAFQVMDDVLRDLTTPGRLPALREIVVAGHGSGGQMVQRYAVLNGVDEALRAQGLALSYVVSNADSYLYLTPDRPRPDGRGYARYERGICPNYDQYRYGLDSLPPLLGKPDRARLAARYAGRSVVYLFGSADNNPEQPGLDKSCGAEAQGATRLARGLNYWRYLTQPGHGRATSHRAFEVSNAGHGGAHLYRSTCAVQALMGPSAVSSADASRCIPLVDAADKSGAPAKSGAPR